MITHIQGEKYANNPRQITRKQFERLKADLAELGDLSGVVHDLNSNQFIGGNQRSEAFNINNCEIELVEQYAQPDKQGTVAHGFIIWLGGRYAYRQVRWTEQQCRAANIKANIDGGSWDADIIASWSVDELQAYGWDADTLRAWNSDAGALSSFLASQIDYDELWQGMPEFQQDDKSGIILTIHFLNEEDKQDFYSKLSQAGVNINNTTRSFWYPERPEDLRHQTNPGKIVYGLES